ncbi:hypothetical protein MKW94_016096, partial [Papaver nudicaule]|nr:hypothetical protein [Papaver nudicaule]
MDDNWKLAKDFIGRHPDSVKVPITCGRTALHIAAGAGHSQFVLELIERMPIEALELKDSYDGNTALHLAVIAGLEDAVKAMVQKHENLKRICNKKGLNPLFNAALHVTVEHKEIMIFLCDKMRDEEPSSFQGHSGAQLICNITRAGFYELASKLIQEYPSLATEREEDQNTVLDVLAEKSPAIGRIYSPRHFLVDIMYYNFHREILKAAIFQGLLDQIFEVISHMTKKDMYRFLLSTNFLRSAAKNGSMEIVKKFISTYPDQLWFPHEGKNIFQIAVENRQADIFNYLYDHMNADEKILTTRTLELNGGNILHVAAKIAPPSTLNLFTSPVAQMQSEIRWFK